MVDQFEERPELPSGDAGTPVPRAAPEAQLSGKHTPGPWKIVLYGDGDSLVIHDGDSHNRICFMATPGESPGAMERIAANAHLIAAAPDLLTELKTAVYAEERTSSGVYVQDIDRWLERARAAIAKAEGRS